MTFVAPVNPDLFYPESDGKPMAENTEQFRWIVMLKENLEILFAADPNVFIAGDLLWYPVEGDNKTSQAPDVMVAVGRPKGRRGSYQQWKEGQIAPQVVFEILSPSNHATEMLAKQEFYDRYGIEEYYIYDPDRLRLTGWLRQSPGLVAIPEMDSWTSPRLGIQFTQVQGELAVYRPDGQRFLSSVELAQQAEQAQARAEQAEVRAEQAEAQARRLAEHLRSLGIDPNQL